ncbi:MAG: DUF4139 domain-containing protein [Planctomycetota bacterium]
MKPSIVLFLLGSWIACGTSSALAAVDLVTVPERRAAELTIYNSADLTLVRDRRLLTFQRGSNVLQFTWAQTLIDASSIELHFRSHARDLTLIDTVFPPAPSEALQWNVESTFDGDAEVEITYFTSNITWSASYLAHLSQDDTRLRLRGDVLVTNQSGEDYPNAEVRLIVGTVNLVEQIAVLARTRGGWSQLAPQERSQAYGGLRDAEKRATEALAAADESNGIVKEGLSEYFVFRIDGAQSVPHGWSRSLNALDVDDVPVEVTFRLHDSWGADVYRFARFDNRKLPGREGHSNLGLAPLPSGSLHVFRRSDLQDLSFLAQVHLPYVAINEKCEINTGAQQEVTIERATRSYRRQNIVFERKTLRAYDEVFEYETSIRNSLPFAARVEIERTFPASASVSGLDFNVETVDHQTIRFYPTSPRGTHDTFQYTVIVKHGTP